MHKHCALYKNCSGTAHRVVESVVRAQMRQSAHCCRKSLLDRCFVCNRAIAALVQAHAGGVQRDHHLVMMDGKLDGAGRSALLKPVNAVGLLQAGNDRFFDDRLAVGDAVQLGFSAPSRS